MTTRVKMLLVGGLMFLLGLLVSGNMPFVYAQGKGKDPVWTHGMELRVRKTGEAEFKDAKKISIEVFKDEATGNLIYISETGSIAVVPGK